MISRTAKTAGATTVIATVMAPTIVPGCTTAHARHAPSIPANSQGNGLRLLKAAIRRRADVVVKEDIRAEALRKSARANPVIK